MPTLVFLGRSILTLCLLILTVAIAQAGATAASDLDTLSNKDIIMILFGLLQTVFMGIGVWLINNDRELFTRMSKVETEQAVRDKLCEERNSECPPPHNHQRASDTDPAIALVDAVKALNGILDRMNKETFK